MDNLPGVPLAYLITFRTFGTWLHGDSRGSVDRREARFGAPTISPDDRWQSYERGLLTRPSVILDAPRRESTRAAILETCAMRGWGLVAMNVRTNHVHTVVSANVPPERVLCAFKANATRIMRSRGWWDHEKSPWTDGGSTRYIWSEASLERAIAYVLHGQGPPLD